jgi:outer membrane protein assembly factor BamB
VYVTGASAGKTSGKDYATVAYDAATCAQRWVSRYNGPANSNDRANMVIAAPGGRTVYVTGASGRNAAGDFATVAYNAATGARRWVSRYKRPARCSRCPAGVAA